jgi:hypothetical protein
MADATTRLADGFVAAPILRACLKQGVFAFLDAATRDPIGHPPCTPTELAAALSLKDGYLAVMLRTLRGLGWVHRDRLGRDILTPLGQRCVTAELQGAAPDLAELLPLNLLALFGLRGSSYAGGDAQAQQEAATFAQWCAQARLGWDRRLEPSHASLYTCCLCAYAVVSLHQSGRLMGLAGGNIDLEGNRLEVEAEPARRDASSHTLDLSAVHPVACQALKQLCASMGWSDAGE